MKKIMIRVCSLCLVLASLLLTACAGSFFEEEAVQISSVESEVLEDGQTKITIKYTDPFMDPFVFYIPKGENGEKGLDGNGIKEIVCDHDEEDMFTTVTIKFTEEGVAPVSFNVPDGRSIVGVKEGFDEETSKSYFALLYNDGTMSAPVYLAKGDKGNGINDYDHSILDDGSVYVYFTFDDGEKLEFTIPAAKGIAHMSSREENGVYFVDVIYTDGSEAHLDFPRPADPNKWHNGSDTPSRILGKDGDYFFDSYHKVIYVKESGSWNKVVSFNDQESEYTVTFKLNDSADAQAGFTGTVASSYTVKRGAYFSANGNGEIPIPHRTGYVFKGWYTQTTLNAAMSPFTDLTPVFSDLELYAIWEPEVKAK